MTPLETAALLISEASVGFDNEHHWINWKKKHAAEIAKLPIGLRNKVLLAWSQAMAREVAR